MITTLIIPAPRLPDPNPTHLLIGRLAGASPATPPHSPAAPDQLGSLIGDGITTLVSGSVDQVMKAIWESCTWLLGLAFSLVDALSTFSVSQTDGPVGQLWPTLLALSGAVALGMFFWQIALAAARGGRGMAHAATGTVSYGIALALTVTVVASLLASADGLTELLLNQGIHASTFTAAYQHIPFSQIALDKAKPVALGLIGVFGLLPAAFGYTLEMVFRQAAILVLVASVPITAAGLLARSTARWFWITTRWVIAAIILKPTIALVLVIGLSALSGAQGFMGLLAGVAVLWVALVSPAALFKLLAFIDPATDAGASFRDAANSLTSRMGTPAFAGGGDSGSGYASFGANSASNDNSGGVGDLEQANTARFDSAASPGSVSSDVGIPPPPPAGSDSGTDSGTDSGRPPSGADSHSTSTPPAPPTQGPNASPGAEPGPTECGSGDHHGPPTQPDPGTDPPDHPDRGDSGGAGGTRPPQPPHGGGGGGGGGSSAAATEAAETAAVII